MGTRFKDYFEDHDGDAPQYLADLPQGWKDGTEGDDVCPSLRRDFGGDGMAVALRLFVDYADEDRRELSGLKRFRLSSWDENEEFLADQFSTDDWSEMVVFVRTV